MAYHFLDVNRPDDSEIIFRIDYDDDDDDENEDD